MHEMKDELEAGLKAKFYLASDDDEDEDDKPEKEFDDEDEETVGGEREIAISYACEDCDYRWEVYLEEEDDELDDTQYCPMCGSANTSQI
jgi:DNA-directed RNA polymerase subunit RPC12/RpoP